MSESFFLPDFLYTKHVDPIPYDLLHSSDRRWLIQYWLDHMCVVPSSENCLDKDYKTIGINGFHSTPWTGLGILVCEGSFMWLSYDSKFAHILDNYIFSPGDGYLLNSLDKTFIDKCHIKNKVELIDKIFTREDAEPNISTELFVNQWFISSMVPLEPNSKMLCLYYSHPKNQLPKTPTLGCIDFQFILKDSFIDFNASPEYIYTSGYGEIEINGNAKSEKQFISVSENKILKIKAITDTFFLTFKKINNINDSFF